uniref:Uncharacterized protein n=1 Tax=Cannabis sativa TaxID=3483 RepID=A0A803R5T3_CANSA
MFIIMYISSFMIFIRHMLIYPSNQEIITSLLYHLAIMASLIKFVSFFIFHRMAYQVTNQKVKLILR